MEVTMDFAALCARPLEPDLGLILDRARRLLPTLTEWIEPLGVDHQELVQRMRLAPTRRPDGTEAWGLWWHENPERRPIFVVRISALERADTIAWSLKSLEDYYDVETGDRGADARWGDAVGATTDVVEFHMYSGDASGPGDLVRWSVAGAILEQTGGLVETLGSFHVLESGQFRIVASSD